MLQVVVCVSHSGIKYNPEQEWFDLRQAAMDRFKGENQALMKRLKELEESGDPY